MHRMIRRALALGLGFLVLALAAPPAGARSSSFAYQANTGLLIEEVIEPNSSLQLKTDYTLDAFGNRIAATTSGADIASRTSTATYDAKGQFVTTDSNALNQTESFQFDARFGLPTSHTNPNNLTTSATYDSLGRKTQERRPDGTSTRWTYTLCTGNAEPTGPGGAASCPQTTFVTSSNQSVIDPAIYFVQITPLGPDGQTPNGPTVTSYRDGRDLEVASDTQGFGGSLVRVLTVYDDQGRVAQTSRPFFVTGGTPVFTTLAYDQLSRVVTQTLPDGSTVQTAYNGLSVTVTNKLSQTRTAVSNSFGQVVSVTDALSQTMTYKYDVFGDLLTAKDAVGNVTTLTYDTRGRKVSANDPDLGLWQWSYDTLDEVVSQTDAKGQAVTFQYDLLSRLTHRVEPDMVCNWTYDTAAHGIGQLATVTISSGPSSGYQRSYSYDGLSRPSQVTLTVNGTSYTGTTAYDGNGRVSGLTYPSGFAVAYAYTALGYQSQLSNAATGQVYWTANARDASLNLTQQTAGNGVITNQSFDPLTNRLTAIASAPAGSTGTVTNFSYGYDVLGNLLSRSDANDSLTESFTYDALNRVLTATVTNGTAKTFTYDPTGNLTAKSDVGNYLYPTPASPRPHAVQSISGGPLGTTSFSYDANGNQLTGAGRTLGYASFNKPSSIVQGSTTISFTHDPDHQRLTQQAPEGTTVYLSGLGFQVEKFTGTGGVVQWNEYLATASGLIGVRMERSDGTAPVRYYHQDHLGSVVTITNETGTVVERSSFDAWGKRRFANGADDPAGSLTSQTTQGYTGQEELQDVGLVHMNGRVYDPRVGRFTSADPILQDPLNPQNWNRYSYVLNNPLRLVDPTGFWGEDDSSGGGCESDCNGDGSVGGNSGCESDCGSGNGGVQTQTVQTAVAETESISQTTSVSLAQNSSGFSGPGFGGLGSGLLDAGNTLGASPLLGGAVAPGAPLSNVFLAANQGSIYGGVLLFLDSSPATYAYAYANGNTPNATSPAFLALVDTTGLFVGTRTITGIAARLAVPLTLPLLLSGDTIQSDQDKQWVYLTYTRTNSDTKQVYSGRTSGWAGTTADLDILAARRGNADDQQRLTDTGFGPPVIDKYSTEYDPIRGREQQLIDYYGGAQSVGGTSANRINGVSDFNLARPIYLSASVAAFGALKDNSPSRFRIGGNYGL